ncbi:hypothetical protein ACP4OV_020236 [Aristida adscensionis]
MGAARQAAVAARRGPRWHAGAGTARRVAAPARRGPRRSLRAAALGRAWRDGPRWPRAGVLGGHGGCGGARAGTARRAAAPAAAVGQPRARVPGGGTRSGAARWVAAPACRGPRRSRRRWVGRSAAGRVGHAQGSLAAAATLVLARQVGPSLSLSLHRSHACPCSVAAGARTSRHRVPVRRPTQPTPARPLAPHRIRAAGARSSRNRAPPRPPARRPRGLHASWGCFRLERAWPQLSRHPHCRCTARLPAAAPPHPARRTTEGEADQADVLGGSEPRKWMRGKGRATVQFGCCYSYATDCRGNPPLLPGFGGRRRRGFGGSVVFFTPGITETGLLGRKGEESGKREYYGGPMVAPGKEP